jgi:hypothetical protein
MISMYYDLLVLNRLLPSVVELHSAQRLVHVHEVSEMQYGIPSLLAVRSGKFPRYLRGDIVVGFCKWLCGLHRHASISYHIQYTLACNALCFCIYEDMNQIGSFT